MDEHLSDKEIANLETECTVEVIKADRDTGRGTVDIIFKYKDNITSDFIIGDVSGKIAFTCGHLPTKVYNKACKAIKEKLKRENRYDIEPKERYTKVKERVVVRELIIKKDGENNTER